MHSKIVSFSTDALTTDLLKALWREGSKSIIVTPVIQDLQRLLTGHFQEKNAGEM